MSLTLGGNPRRTERDAAYISISSGLVEAGGDGSGLCPALATVQQRWAGGEVNTHRQTAPTQSRAALLSQRENSSGGIRLTAPDTGAT